MNNERRAFTDQFVFSDEAAKLSARNQLAPLSQDQLRTAQILQDYSITMNIHSKSDFVIASEQQIKTQANQNTVEFKYLIVNDWIWGVLVTTLKESAERNEVTIAIQKKKIQMLCSIIRVVY